MTLGEAIHEGDAPTREAGAAAISGPVAAGFPRAGEVFGPWRLLEHIADGGFGSVWRAAAIHDVHTDRRRVGAGENAAVKFFAATSDAHRSRIAREVSLGRRLGGHWTPECLGADLDAIPQWAAFEFVTDATLRDLVRTTGPLSAHALEVFAEDLWDALTFFRQHGVAHRDLTPANIHVNAVSAKPRVIDWGNAGEAGAGPPTAQLPRTPGYAAPEQVEGSPAGPAADLWSWGAVVCFAATGHPPLPVERYHQTIVRCDTPLDLTGVPVSMLPALDAALRWDPDDRDSDTIASHLPGRRAHVELEEARSREADLDAALADLQRRMRLRDERIEELGEQIRSHERERLEVRAVVGRLRAAESERDDAAREVTRLRARLTQLERVRDDRDLRTAAVDAATDAIRRAVVRPDVIRRVVVAAARDRVGVIGLKWRNRRLERELESHRRSAGRIATPWPFRVASASGLVVTVGALARATWESVWYPVPGLIVAAIGCVVARGVPARSGAWRDQLRAAGLGVAVAAPFLAPLAFSAGVLPSASIARWLVEAPFPTPPPPDHLEVGHGGRVADVDPDDCVVVLPDHSFWDVRIGDC